jgi:hypothetical protein
MFAELTMLIKLGLLSFAEITKALYKLFSEFHLKKALLTYSKVLSL